LAIKLGVKVVGGKVVTSPVRTDEVEIGSQVVFVVRRGGKPAIMEGLGICKVLQVSRGSAVVESKGSQPVLPTENLLVVIDSSTGTTNKKFFGAVEKAGNGDFAELSEILQEAVDAFDEILPVENEKVAGNIEISNVIICGYFVPKVGTVIQDNIVVRGKRLNRRWEVIASDWKNPKFFKAKNEQGEVKDVPANREYWMIDEEDLRMNVSIRWGRMKEFTRLGGFMRIQDGDRMVPVRVFDSKSKPGTMHAVINGGHFKMVNGNNVRLRLSKAEYDTLIAVAEHLKKLEAKRKPGEA
jgi:hypothetical protein